MEIIYLTMITGVSFVCNFQVKSRIYYKYFKAYVNAVH